MALQTSLSYFDHLCPFSLRSRLRIRMPGDLLRRVCTSRVQRQRWWWWPLLFPLCWGIAMYPTRSKAIMMMTLPIPSMLGYCHVPHQVEGSDDDPSYSLYARVLPCTPPGWRQWWWPLLFPLCWGIAVYHTRSKVMMMMTPPVPSLLGYCCVPHQVKGNDDDDPSYSLSAGVLPCTPPGQRQWWWWPLLFPLCWGIAMYPTRSEAMMMMTPPFPSLLGYCHVPHQVEGNDDDDDPSYSLSAEVLPCTPPGPSWLLDPGLSFIHYLSAYLFTYFLCTWYRFLYLLLVYLFVYFLEGDVWGFVIVISAWSWGDCVAVASVSTLNVHFFGPPCGWEALARLIDIDLFYWMKTFNSQNLSISIILHSLITHPW